MPFANQNLSNVFRSGVSVSAGAITISGGGISSFTPSSNTTGVYEMCFGLIDTIAAAVATGNLTNLTVSESQSVPDISTLRKTYTFTINLGLDETALDVKPE
jgi:hypothetical protein